MRNISIGILIGLMIAAPFAFTQTPSETIFIETPLQIGMSKDTAVSHLAEQGLRLTKVKDQESWIVTKKNDRGEYDAIGNLSFSESRLWWASKSWATATDMETAKLARSFYFLVKSFEDQGKKTCVLETKNEEASDLDSKQLLIHCGRRTATLYVTAFKGQRSSVSLDETIK